MHALAVAAVVMLVRAHRYMLLFLSVEFPSFAPLFKHCPNDVRRVSMQIALEKVNSNVITKSDWNERTRISHLISFELSRVESSPWSACRIEENDFECWQSKLMEWKLLRLILEAFSLLFFSNSFKQTSEKRQDKRLRREDSFFLSFLCCTKW